MNDIILIAMKRMILFCMGLFTATMLIAQFPEAFNYQAVVRDASGAVLANKSVNFRISILKGGVFGSTVLQETHPVATNEFGLVNLEIGNGHNITGSISSIDWGNDLYFLKTELDPAGGSAFIQLGISQLLGVPYALHAKTVEKDQVNDADADPTNEIQTIQLSGAQLTLNKGGGTVTLPSTGDNWGSQSVVTNLTMEGNGTAALPLKLASQRAMIGSVLKWDGTNWSPGTDLTGTGNPTGPAGGDLSGTYPDPLIGNGKVTSAKIADGAVTSADLANDAVTVAKISAAGADANKVIQYNGSDVAWDYAPGAEIKVTIINSGCYSAASFGTSSYVKIADIGSFTKTIAGSRVEVTFHGRIWAQTMTGTGAHFEVRVDNSPTTNGRARANLRSSQAGGVGEYVCITGVFTGLSAGSHTVSMWVIGAGGSGTNGGLDPGCWSDDHVIVREVR